MERSVEEIPDAVDMAVVMIPAPAVPGILEALGRKGVRHAVIETAGFGEYREGGNALEMEIDRIDAA